ncbi:ROK family transcriptional regulator [Bifidobacterium aquikefiri]|uniref:ROK family transcriptional regulator n=1 Tax=Bifidobacterium aquikefiri TaxID=1653207 RepID=UPI0039ECFD23
MKQAASEGTPSSISELNRSRIINFLFRNGISSRAQIAKATGLTAAAITKITARLIDFGVISETGDLEGAMNRRSIGLQFNDSRYEVIAVKFARSLVQIGIFELSGRCIKIHDFPPVNNEDVIDTVSQIKQYIKSTIAHNPAIVAVGMAVPGPYLSDEGRIISVTSMQMWKEVNFKKEFTQAFAVPTFIEHDAQSGALAQSLFGTQTDGNSLAYYLIGEGVGVGVIDNGNLVSGSRGVATEIGHLSIDINGRPCECGNVGCLERYCSTGAVKELLQEPSNRGILEGVNDLLPREVCNRLFKESYAGNAEAQRIVREIARYIAYGCINIIYGYNPSQIIIGDILSEAGDTMLDEVRRIVAERVLPDLMESTTITLSDLPTDATLTGAAAVAASQFLRNPSRFVAGMDTPKR